MLFITVYKEYRYIYLRFPKITCRLLRNKSVLFHPKFNQFKQTEMKNFKILAVLIAFIAIPFLSKAQIAANKKYITVYYHDLGGYGPLSCTATATLTTQSYVMPPNTSYVFTAIVSQFYSFKFSALGNDQTLSVSGDLEAQAIGDVVYYDFVPRSPSGTAPIYSVVRNSAYNYTITTYAIPL
jgi:hypothetical protein